jgi:hypothetical protein
MEFLKSNIDYIVVGVIVVCIIVIIKITIKEHKQRIKDFDEKYKNI